MGHFPNEKLLFSELIRYTHSSPSQRCSRRDELLNYFSVNKNSLNVSCGPDRVFSHCQPYYLFSINMKQKRCSPYRLSPYTNASSPIQVTLITQISMGRFDRMPYILKRWKGPMSIAVFVTLEEYSSFVNAITPYLGLPITFSVYIPLGLEHSSYFVRGNGKKTVFAHTLYPINLLRDMAIESIHTTHFFCVDADFFFSDTVAKAIGNNMDLLKNDSSLLLFTTYQVSRWSPHFKSCKLRGKKCLTIWDSLPQNKVQLRRCVKRNRIQPIGSLFHTITNYKQWIRLETVKAYKTKVKRDIEPYIIMRRSILNPIFHPYYIEYGYDKLEFFARLMAYKRFRYFVLPQDFGIDIPHKRSSYSRMFRQDRKVHIMSELARFEYDFLSQYSGSVSS
ncbi:hypothetical protein WA588_006179 [Blastocystis sp. NMH]